MSDHDQWHEHKPEKPKSDNEYFERMSHVIFMAGLNWRVLDKKWPGIKKAFANFNIDKVAAFSEAQTEELMFTPEVIHNFAKIKAIVKNAEETQEVVKEYGSFAKYLDALRSDGGEDNLRAKLSKRFGFLGKATTVIFLFSVGEDLPYAHAEWHSRNS